ncbi:MAG: DUF2339 domain-containing protein, partial [bacterium]
MEILIVILIVVLFIWFRNSLSGEIQKLRREVVILRELLLKKEPTQEKKFQKSATVIPDPEIKKEEPPPIVQEEIISNEPEIIREVKFPPFEAPVFSDIKKSEPSQVKILETIIPKKSFFESHPDLEKFIGENLINKIGIAILVLGIAFFVKYA